MLTKHFPANETFHTNDLLLLVESISHIYEEASCDCFFCGFQRDGSRGWAARAVVIVGMVSGLTLVAEQGNGSSF